MHKNMVRCFLESHFADVNRLPALVYSNTDNN